MQMEPVDSSMIGAIGYDAEKQELAVRFKSGSIVTYGNVPPDVAEAMRGAESVGKYFHSAISGQFDPV